MKIKKTSNELLWKEALKNCFLSWKELSEFLNLKDTKDFKIDNIKNFPMKVTKSFANRMEKNNINDPLLKQVITTTAELQNKKNYELDPLKEIYFNKIEGLIHKYYNRVLIIISGNCATNCRYCFRRNFNYNKQRQSIKILMANLFEYIKNKHEIEEIILSGGDPLIHNNSVLEYIFKKIQLIPHVKRIRIHTRIPIFLPERITEGLIEVFSKIKIQKVMVIHSNHPSEISLEVENALNLIKDCGFTILNQSTLLKDVNDNPYILKKLSDKLFNSSVIPYYLHLLDHVKGTEHFHIDDKLAINIYNKFKNISSGFLVPKLSREKVYKKSKLWIN